MGSSQSRMPGLSRVQEHPLPKCLGSYFSQIFPGKFQYPGNAGWLAGGTLLTLNLNKRIFCYFSGIKEVCLTSQCVQTGK